MCNIDTIRQFIVEVRYDGNAAEYDHDCERGYEHVCDGEQGDCNLCFLISICSCEDVIESELDLLQIVDGNAEYDESEVLGDPEAYYGYRDEDDSDDTEEPEETALEIFINPIYEDVYGHAMNEFEHDQNLKYHYMMFIHSLNLYEKPLSKLGLKEPIFQCVVEMKNNAINKRVKFKRIKKELIAAAMHPCRIQYSMTHCDDIEDWFNAIGC